MEEEMVEILCFVIIALLIIAILILVFKKPKTGTDQLTKAAVEQNVKMDAVSKQLDNVFERIIHMERISDEVDNLSKVLTNVGTRGAFGEAQLGRMLEQTIPGMYVRNYKPNPRSTDHVEYAIKIPNGKNKDFTYLPVDSKFPMDKYSVLVQASEGNNPDEVEAARKDLITFIDRSATTIKNKYIRVPQTTNFAIMFLPTEGLYLEAVKDPGNIQYKLQERGIMIAGPSTILALLNSLSMGFNMIEINESADEIRKMLGNIKQQFEKFNKNFETIESGIATASRGLTDAKDRSRQINNALDRVEITED
ncbi:MAG: DNA recombination protein RmuC [Coriobacteriia bacterium]|nr:DNA recombination protein RmuC [Coriobacteriia bacterium]